jgi:hypothetical protein
VEHWLKVWRDGFQPQATGAALLLLRLRLQKQEIDPLEDLGNQDCRLLRGTTTYPPALGGMLDWPCDAGCAVTTLALTEDRATVEQANNAFGRMCLEADRRLGEEAACRWFLNFYDQAPWPVVRAGLLAELDQEIDRRAAVGKPQALTVT